MKICNKINIKLNFYSLNNNLIKYYNINNNKITNINKIIKIPKMF